MWQINGIVIYIYLKLNSYKNVVPLNCSPLALQDVPESSDATGSVLHSEAPNIHVLGWRQAVNQRCDGMFCAAGKWLICVHLHHGSGEKIK